MLRQASLLASFPSVGIQARLKRDPSKSMPYHAVKNAIPTKKPTKWKERDLATASFEGFGRSIRKPLLMQNLFYGA